MYWQQWSQALQSRLRLDTDPVAVTFAGPPADSEPPPQGKVSVCQALSRASRGETITITAQSCGCPGGLVSLGLGQLPPEGRERLVEFLVNREKVYCSRAALYRSQQTLSPPAGIASRVLFSPLTAARLLPDVVVFVGRPGSLHLLLSYATYWEGGSMMAELAGPACRTGVAYPVVTGQIGLSLLDFGARRLAQFGDDQLLVSVPFHRMIGLVHAFEQGVGARHEESVEAVERQIDELGRIEPA